MKPRRNASRKSRVEALRTLAVSKEAAPFKRAAEAYVEKATSSPQAANNALVLLGIYTSRGKLTKNYR